MIFRRTSSAGHKNEEQTRRLNTHMHYNIYIAVYDDIAPQQSIRRTNLLVRLHRERRLGITAVTVGFVTASLPRVTTISRIPFAWWTDGLVQPFSVSTEVGEIEAPSNIFSSFPHIRHHQTALLPCCTSDLTSAKISYCYCYSWIIKH